MSQNRITCVVQDYDLDKIVNSGQLFRVTPAKQRGQYLVAMRDEYCLVQQENNTVIIDSYGKSLDWLQILGVSTPYDAEKLKEFMSQSKYLRTVYEFSKGIRLTRQDPWETLIGFIVSQRNHVFRIKEILKSACSILGYRIKGDPQYEVYSFPKPSDLKVGSLSGCGLGYREPYIYEAACMVDAGYIDLSQLTVEKCSSRVALSQLMSLRGVGAKVASCVALFGLGHTDMFPIDVWISRAMKEGNITGSMIESWGEMSGLIQQYIYYYMTHRNKIYNTESSI